MATNSSRVRVMRVDAAWSTVLLSGHSDAVLSIDVLDNAIATASKDKTCRIWRKKRDGAYACVAKCVGHVDTVGAVALAYALDGSMCAVSASRDRTLKRWTGFGDASDCKEAASTASVAAHLKDVNCVSRSADSKLMVTARATQGLLKTRWRR